MVALRIGFEPFIDEAARQFIVNGVDYYNIAATSLPGYFPVPVGNSRPDILVVQPTQYWYGQGLTDGLDSAGDRRVLLQ